MMNFPVKNNQDYIFEKFFKIEQDYIFERFLKISKIIFLKGF